MKMLKLLLTLLIVNQTTLAFASDLPPEVILAQGGTGFRINDIRVFESDENTVFLHDGEPIPVINAQGGTGYKVKYSVSDASPNLTTGTLDEVNLITIYKGVLLSKSPFKVFGLPGLTSNQTYFPNGSHLDDLAIGDSVLVSGYIDNNSLSIITRVEKVATLSEWKLSGHIENLTNNQFNINNQVIQYLPSHLGSCNAGFNNGTFVEVFATPTQGFSSNDPIDTVIQINCISRSVNPGFNTDVIVEGMIDWVEMSGNFVLSGQEIEVNQQTKYIRGRKTDIQERIKVEVEGAVDGITGTVIAGKIRFLEDRINLTLPVEVSNFNLPNITISGLNLITSPLTLDPDQVLSNGISETTQLQFRGYDSGNGDLYVTRIDIRGQVNYNNVKIDGFITNINEPLIQVFGLNIDTTSTEFINQDGQIISSVDFFNSITVGAKVKLENAHLDGISGLISAGTLTIDSLLEPQSNKNISNNGTVVYGVGTMTGLADIIFNSSFE